MSLVIEQTENGTVTIDLESRLMGARHIFLTSDVNPSSTNDLMTKILYLDSISNDPIRLYVNSPGGHVVSGMCLVDIFDYVKSPIHTFCVGHAASMAFVIMACGQKGQRRALASSQFMMHDLSSGFYGSHGKELIPQIKSVNDVKENLMTRLSLAIKKPKKLIEKELITVDRYFTAYEAKEYGIIDEVIERE